MNLKRGDFVARKRDGDVGRVERVLRARGEKPERATVQWLGSWVRSTIMTTGLREPTDDELRFHGLARSEQV